MNFKYELNKAGWYKGRSIDIAEIEYIYTSGGYLLFDKARRFIKEYGLLKFDLSEYDRNTFGSRLEIDPIGAVSGIDIKTIQGYYEKIGKT